MASGTQEHLHHHQQQQQQQQQQQEHLIQHQHQSNQMQFAPTSLASNFVSHQQVYQVGAMSPISAPMSIDNTQGHLISMNPHQHQQPHMMDTVMSSASMGQDSCNQTTTHIQHQLSASHQQQKSQLLPLLLSPRPPSLKNNTTDPNEQPESDHDQIIEQVISLENEYSDSSGTMANVDGNLDIMMSHHHQRQQQQQQQHGDTNLTGASCASDSNQLSSSSEDLLNLLLEFDGEPSNLLGLDGNHPLDPDERAGIENIRKQLMSCEVQSDHTNNQNTNSMSPIVSQMTCQTPQPGHNMQQQQQQQQQRQPMLSQPGQVIHQQQSHHLTSPGLSQSTQQQILIHGSYSNVPVSTVPISSSGQSYAPPQQHQNVARISQSNQMSIVNNSPSPSWQQPQLSPYSPQQNQHNNTRTTSSQRQNQHPTVTQQQTTTSPQMQQLHHPLQRASPSQSVSPPATTEPSPVVKKNPLLNAQLVNSRPPSITPTRFLNNQTNILNQNPILNAKLSQSPFSAGAIGSSVNQNLNPQPRFIQQPQQSSNFNYDLNKQQHQQNTQQHTPPAQQSGHLSLYRPSDQQQQQQQQQSNQIFKTTTASTSGITGGGSPSNMGTTSPSGGLSQQVKQEIRRKVQQPKQQQQHQTTSLLKQLLSDDNK